MAPMSGLIVPIDPTAIDGECGCLLGRLVPRANATCQGVVKIAVAELRDCQRLSFGDFVAAGIAAPDDFAEKTLGLLARRVRCPGCTVATYRVPPLPTLGRSEPQDVGDRIALLATRAEQRDCRVPDGLAHTERPNLFEANSLSAHSRARMLVASRCSYHIATNFAQTIANSGRGLQSKTIRICPFLKSTQSRATTGKRPELPCQGWGRGFESLRPLQFSR